MKTCPTCKQALPDDALFCPMDGTSLASAESDPLLGTVIADRYVLLERVGQGNSGTIYRGEHVVLRQKIAVKLLHHKLSKDETAVDRFRGEAATLAQIDSDHIVRVSDFGVAEDGRVFFAMEFLDGETLAAALGREGRFKEDRAVRVMTQVAEALSEAHKLGYVHRDIRPRNIFLCERKGEKDFVKLLDFGLAKLMEVPKGAKTALGTTLGDPRYMSPEQARGDQVDQRSDIYSLAIIGYQIVTGSPPFVGAGTFDVLTKHLEAQPVPIPDKAKGVSKHFADAVARALAKKPQDRYPTVTRFLEALAGKAPVEVSLEEKAKALKTTPAPGPKADDPAATMAYTAKQAEPAKTLMGTGADVKKVMAALDDAQTEKFAKIDEAPTDKLAKPGAAAKATPAAAAEASPPAADVPKPPAPQGAPWPATGPQAAKSAAKPAAAKPEPAELGDKGGVLPTTQRSPVSASVKAAATEPPVADDRPTIVEQPAYKPEDKPAAAPLQPTVPASSPIAAQATQADTPEDKAEEKAPAAGSTTSPPAAGGIQRVASHPGFDPDVQSYDANSQSGNWFAEGLAAEQQLATSTKSGPLPAIYDALDDEEESLKRNIPTGAIIGVVVGAAAVFLFLFLVVFRSSDEPEKKPKLAAKHVENPATENPVPKPEPEPKPEPKDEPGISTKDEPKAEPKPEPKAEPKPEPKPEPAPKPKPEPKPKPKPKKVEPKSKPKPKPKPAAVRRPKPKPKPRPRKPKMGLGRDPLAAATHVKEGRVQLQRGAYSKARGEFAKALEADPRNAGAHAGLGEVAFELGKYSLAAKHLRTAARLNPRSARYRYHLGNAYFKMGRTKGAVEQYRAALKISPNYAAARSGLEAAVRRLAGGG
jgi:serine/threonine-protein kinase